MGNIRDWSKAFLTQCCFLVVLMSIGLSMPAFAFDNDDARASLRGLGGMGLVIEKFSPDAIKHGLDEGVIQSAVESKLRQIGIKVLTEKERHSTLGSPYLYVDINTVKKKSVNLYSYSIQISLNQYVVLDRDKAITVSGSTWSREIVGNIGSVRLARIQENVLELTNMFIDAYLAVNPKE